MKFAISDLAAKWPEMLLHDRATCHLKGVAIDLLLKHSVFRLVRRFGGGF
jgi:hypothetical protein